LGPTFVALHPEFASIRDKNIWTIEHVWSPGCSCVDEGVDLSKCGHLDGIHPIGCACRYHIGSDARGKEEEWCEKHDAYYCYYRVINYSVRIDVDDVG
jgi:hypothetical protein